MAESADAFPRSPAWLELPGKQTHVLKGDCHIGRVAGNEIVNPDSRISRRNSVVQREGGHYVLVDLGSTNGTYLNEQRIFKPTRLKDRDVILVGSERYVFRQPPEADGPPTDSAQSLLNRTMVAVGQSTCWMLRASPGPASAPGAAEWSEQLRVFLQQSGASVKRLPDAVVFAHWRDGRISAAAVKTVVTELAQRPRPPLARIVVHHGNARIGPGANPSEENLLGPEVTFTHQMGALAARLGGEISLSEAAVKTLGFTAARPLGEQVIPGVVGVRAMFAV